MPKQEWYQKLNEIKYWEQVFKIVFMTENEFEMFDGHFILIMFTIIYSPSFLHQV